MIGYAGTMGLQDGVDYLLRALQCLIDLGRTDFFVSSLAMETLFPT